MSVTALPTHDTADTRVVAQQQAQAVTTQGMIFDFETIQNMQRMAEIMASARVSVPQHLANNPGDCLAIVMQAAQWQMNPFAVAQKTFLVQGKLGYEAQLINAAVSSSSVLSGRINYEFFGPWERVLGKFRVAKNKDGKEFRVPNWSAEDETGCGVVVSATLRGEQSPRSLTVELVQARTRNSTLWAEDPRQQLSYLAVKKWARMHVPDVILGVYSPDELPEQERDMGTAQRAEPEPSPASRTASVKARLAARAKPQPQGPTLDDVLAAIDRAETMADLKAVPAGELADADDKAIARDAWKKKQASLKAAAEASAAEATAEPETEANKDTQLADSLIEAAASASDDDERAEILDAARDLPAEQVARVKAAFPA